MQKQILLIFSLVLIVFSSQIAKAQTNQISEHDKAKIIATILRGQTFESVNQPKTTLKLVYFLTEDISYKALPNIKGIRFEPITEQQITERSKTGVEYYRFSEFEVTGKTVEVKLIKDYINSTAHYSLTYVTLYKCRKVSGRWRVKGGKPEVEVGESYSPEKDN